MRPWRDLGAQRHNTLLCTLVPENSRALRLRPDRTALGPGEWTLSLLIRLPARASASWSRLRTMLWRVGLKRRLPGRIPQTAWGPCFPARVSASLGSSPRTAVACRPPAPTRRSHPQASLGPLLPGSRLGLLRSSPRTMLRVSASSADSPGHIPCWGPLLPARVSLLKVVSAQCAVRVGLSADSPGRIPQLAPCPARVAACRSSRQPQPDVREYVQQATRSPGCPEIITRESDQRACGGDTPLGKTPPSRPVATGRRLQVERHQQAEEQGIDVEVRQQWQEDRHEDDNDLRPFGGQPRMKMMNCARS